MSAALSVWNFFDTLLKNASIFSRGYSPLHAPLGQRATQGHTGGLRSVFSDAHVPGKNRISIYFPAWGRENSAEGFSPYKMVRTSCMMFMFFDSLTGPENVSAFSGPVVVCGYFASGPVHGYLNIQSCCNQSWPCQWHQSPPVPESTYLRRPGSVPQRTPLPRVPHWAALLPPCP